MFLDNILAKTDFTIYLINVYQQIPENRKFIIIS